MASSNAETKKAVAEKVAKTDDDAHRHLQKIKQSKIGKIIPTEYDRLTTRNIAFLGFIVMCFINAYTYMVCLGLGGRTNDNPPAYVFPTSPTGIFLIITSLLSMAHDLFVYTQKKGGLLLSFLALRILAIISAGIAILAIELVAAGYLIKIVLLALFILFNMVYSYIFSIYISELKHGAGGSSISDQQAV